MTTNSSDVVAGTNATATEYNNLRKDMITGTGNAPVDASDGATVTFDLDDGNYQQVTLGGDRTLALDNVNVGQKFVIKLIQDGTGSRTVTWWSGINWAYDIEPTLTATASKKDVFGFICTDTGEYDGFILGLSLS